MTFCFEIFIAMLLYNTLKPVYMSILLVYKIQVAKVASRNVLQAKKLVG